MLLCDKLVEKGNKTSNHVKYVRNELQREKANINEFRDGMSCVGNSLRLLLLITKAWRFACVVKKDGTIDDIILFATLITTKKNDKKDN